MRGVRITPGAAATCFAVGGFAAMAFAGRALRAADLGTSIRERACSITPFGGLALLVLAGVLVAASVTAMRLRRGGVLVADPATGLIAAITPILVLLGTTPGVAGCRSAARVERWDGIGQALVGTSGIALAGAAAFGLGFAIVQAWSVERYIATAVVDEEPSLIDLAIEDAEAYDVDPAARRFRGVDPIE